MRRLAIVVILAVVTVIACGKGSLDPVVPPAQTTPTSTPRFDGVYAAQKGESIDLLRFTAAGHVASITTATQAAIETAVRLLIAESERCAKGTYEVPKSVDYNLWCGPAPMKPLTRPQFHYDWHWMWDYGNGDLGNQGIHQMDLARWALNVNDLGQGVVSYGGRFGYEDAGETANTQICFFDYEGAGSRLRS